MHLLRVLTSHSYRDIAKETGYYWGTFVLELVGVRYSAGCSYNRLQVIHELRRYWDDEVYSGSYVMLRHGTYQSASVNRAV